MSKFESREALAGKIDWEGGLDEAWSYGIRAHEMPEGDVDLFEAWTSAELAWRAFDEKKNAVYDLLEEFFV